MISTDFLIPLDGNYHQIELTSSSMIVYNTTGVRIKFRYGALSNSIGMILEPQQFISVSETIYIQAPTDYRGSPSALIIVVSQ